MHLFLAQAVCRFIIREDLRFPGAAAPERIILQFQPIIVAGFAAGVNVLQPRSLTYGIIESGGGAVTLC